MQWAWAPGGGRAALLGLLGLAQEPSSNRLWAAVGMSRTPSMSGAEPQCSAALPVDQPADGQGCHYWEPVVTDWKPDSAEVGRFAEGDGRPLLLRQQSIRTPPACFARLEAGAAQSASTVPPVSPTMDRPPSAVEQSARQGSEPRATAMRGAPDQQASQVVHRHSTATEARFAG